MFRSPVIRFESINNPELRQHIRNSGKTIFPLRGKSHLTDKAKNGKYNMRVRAKVKTTPLYRSPVISDNPIYCRSGAGLSFAAICPTEDCPPSGEVNRASCPSHPGRSSAPNNPQANPINPSRYILLYQNDFLNDL